MTQFSATRKNPLGKGLASLFGGDSSKDILSSNEEKIKTAALEKKLNMPTNTLIPGRFQPRRYFNEQQLNELTDSIKELGIIQPILVRKIESGVAENGDFVEEPHEIIAGERRWRAARRIGLLDVPVIICEFTDQEALEVALVENIQRDNLTPIEEAYGFQNVMDKFGCTQESLSLKFGKSRSYIANSLRLLNLPERIKNYLGENKISVGHARALLKAKNPENFVEEIIENDLNVREVEQRIKSDKKTTRTSSSRQKDNKDAEILGLEQMLTSVLETPVQVKVKGEKAVLTIACASLRKLDDVVEKIGSSAR